MRASAIELTLVVSNLNLLITAWISVWLVPRQSVPKRFEGTFSKFIMLHENSDQRLLVLIVEASESLPDFILVGNPRTVIGNQAKLLLLPIRNCIAMHFCSIRLLHTCMLLRKTVVRRHLIGHHAVMCLIQSSCKTLDWVVSCQSHDCTHTCALCCKLHF
jgi:hypothetical protein